MPALLLPLIGGLWRAVVGLMGSPVGWCIAAFVAGWVIGGNRVREQWEIETQAREAAYRAEVARQERAAREIADEATRRLSDEQALARDLQVQIDAFDREEAAADVQPVQPAQPVQPVPRSKPSCTPAVVRPCRIDDAFAGRVRQLDAAGRAPAPARRAR